MVGAAMQKTLTKRLIWLISFWGLMVAFSAPALADPPARAGRVAEVVGDAWLFDGENKEWTRVTLNQTVAEGDRLRTDERSRVSLRIGSSSLWLDERSDLEFTQLDEGRVLLSLDKGDLGLRLRSQEAVSEYKVQTREGMAYAEREGLYRVEQLDRGSRAFALQGRLRFESSHAGDSAPVWLQDGEQAEFWWGSLTGARTERQRLVGDGFTDWLQAQSRAEGDTIGSSQRYVSPEMTGAEELDRHGRWEQAPDYGNVWIPNQVGPDWAPYRYGRWVWTSQWGWSWVDDAPWGFAPFHYGRWVNWGGRWCWSPGQYVTRPVYAPALVGWVGGPLSGGSSISIGISIGGRAIRRLMAGIRWHRASSMPLAIATALAMCSASITTETVIVTGRGISGRAATARSAVRSVICRARAGRSGRCPWLMAGRHALCPHHRPAPSWVHCYRLGRSRRRLSNAHRLTCLGAVTTWAAGTVNVRRSGGRVIRRVSQRVTVSLRPHRKALGHPSWARCGPP
ncbi:DUF6600 domain-containing protein [Roseateles sp. GG27B]